MNLKEQILKDLNEMDGSAVDNKYNNIYGKRIWESCTPETNITL